MDMAFPKGGGRGPQSVTQGNPKTLNGVPGTAGLTQRSRVGTVYTQCRFFKSELNL